MIRRYGEPPDPSRRYILRPGVYAILPRDGALLLTLQTELGPEIQLPGGGVDPGEPPLAALHREVWEETGWRLAAPRRLVAYRRFTFMPEYDLWAEKLCTIYIAHPVKRLSEPAEPLHSALWMPASVAAKWLASPGDRACVARFAGHMRG